MGICQDKSEHKRTQKHNKHIQYNNIINEDNNNNSIYPTNNIDNNNTTLKKENTLTNKNNTSTTINNDHKPQSNNQPYQNITEDPLIDKTSLDKTNNDSQLSYSHFKSSLIYNSTSTPLQTLSNPVTSFLHKLFTFPSSHPSSFPLTSLSSQSTFLYYLNQFNLNTKPNYSTHHDYHNIISSYYESKNIYILTSNLLKLKQRQWLLESIHLSNFIKAERESNFDLSLNKYINQLLLLHNDFNWLIYSLSFIYNEYLFNNKVNVFGDINNEYTFPPLDSIDWLNGFEWEGVYIRVIPLHKAKMLLREIKGLNYAYYDYLQLIDCIKLYRGKHDDMKYLSNEIVFPLISYCKVGGMVLYGSACVNKYKYTVDIESLLKASSINNTYISDNDVHWNGCDSGNEGNNNSYEEDNVANGDVDDIETYSMKDMMCSKILKMVSKRNFIKVFYNDETNNDCNKEQMKYKFMLINAYELIPELIESDLNNDDTTIHLLHFNNNNTTSYETYNISSSLSSFTVNELQHIKNDLISKYNFNENDFTSPTELMEHSYAFESFQYKIISKQQSTSHSPTTSSNTSLIYNYFMNLPSLQNPSLSVLLFQKQLTKSSPTLPSTSPCVILFQNNSSLKQQYSFINNHPNYKSFTLSSLSLHLNMFLQKLNTNINTIYDVYSLKNYFKKYAINSSFMFYYIYATNNKFISDLIQINILCSIIKKFFYYHESTNVSNKIQLLLHNEKSLHIFPITSFDLISNNYYKSMEMIRMEKIYIIIKSIFTINDLNVNNNNNNNLYTFIDNNNNNVNSSKDFVMFFYKQISFFTFVKMLKWKTICSKYKLNNYCNNIIEQFSLKTILTNFINAAREHPSIFLNAIENELNITIDIYIKHQLSISIDNINNFNIKHLTQSKLKVNSYLNINEISAYLFSKSINVNNTFTNLNTKSIDINTYNTTNNNSIILSKTNNNNNIFINSPSINSLSKYNNNNNYDNNNNSNNNISTLWKDISSHICFNILFPSITFKLPYINDTALLSSNVKKFLIHRNLSFQYSLLNFDSVLEWHKSLKQITSNIISYNSSYEIELYKCLCFIFVYNLFFLKNESKSNDILFKLQHIQHNQFTLQTQQVLLLKVFESFISSDQNEKSIFISMILTLLLFGDIRSKNNKGHPFIMIILYKVIKILSMKKYNYDYFMDMYKCLEFKLKNKNYYDNANALYVKGFTFINEKNVNVNNEDNVDMDGDIDEFTSELTNNIVISPTNTEKYYMKVNESEFNLDYQQMLMCNDNIVKYNCYFNQLFSFQINERNVFNNHNFIIFVFNSVLSICNWGYNILDNNIINKYHLLNKENDNDNKQMLSVSLSYMNYLLKYIKESLAYNNYCPNGIVLSFDNKNQKQFNIISPKLLFHLCEFKIRKITCGKDHAIALDDKGQCFAWGNNTNGQCGVGSFKARISVPEKVLLLNVKIISAGYDYSLFVIDKDEIFFSGVNHLFTSSFDNKRSVNKPMKVDMGIHHTLSIKDIKCGDRYVLILTTEGNVYTHRHGLITLRDKVKQIAISNNYSFALTDRSDVYVWNCNDSSVNVSMSSTKNNNLSNTSPHSLLNVTPQKMIHIHNVKSIYSGYGYVCMSTSDRGIYYVSTSTPMNNHSTSHIHLTVPTHIDHIHTPSMLSCGMNYVVTLVEDTSTGKQTLLLYNSNIEGIKNTTPIAVNILDEYKNSRVCDICCNDSCTLILLRRNDCNNVHMYTV